MSWKPGKVFSKSGHRGRWWYWRGDKQERRWRTLRSGKPASKPRSKKLRSRRRT